MDRSGIASATPVRAEPDLREHRIDLAKRAGQRRGWAMGTFDQYGKLTEKKYKTFAATWRPTGRDPRGSGGRSDRVGHLLCTNPTATVADIFGCVGDRFSLKTTFRDCKEIVGAGQQQVRFGRASVGVFHVCLWTFTLTEAWSWNQYAQGLVSHRAASPWDDGTRRPSHADKRRAWRRELLAEEIHAALLPGLSETEIRIATERLIDLAA